MALRACVGAGQEPGNWPKVDGPRTTVPSVEPRIAFLPSNEASLLGGRQDGWREKARLIRLDATRKYASHKNACRPRQTFRNSEMLLAEKSVWRNAPCPFFVSCFSPVAEDDVAPSWDLPWVSSQLICRRIHQAAPSAPGST